MNTHRLAHALSLRAPMSMIRKYAGDKMCCCYATNKSTKLFNFIHPPEAPFDWIKHALPYLTTAAYCLASSMSLANWLVTYLPAISTLHSS